MDRNLGSLDLTGFPRFFYLQKFQLRSVLSPKEVGIARLCGRSLRTSQMEIRMKKGWWILWAELLLKRDLKG